ncbi:MAG TPA: hypothetical protein VGD05_03735 [Pyrinomonadaceae bacterium]|jgi:hypothetical protein
MDEFRTTVSEVLLYLSVINVILGVLFGAFPLLSGIIIKNRKYAIWGFLGSIIGGSILGVFLSFPIAIIFTWLILKSPVIEGTNDVAIVDDKSDKADNQ